MFVTAFATRLAELRPFEKAGFGALAAPASRATQVARAHLGCWVA